LGIFFGFFRGFHAQKLEQTLFFFQKQNNGLWEIEENRIYVCLLKDKYKIIF